MITIGDTHSEYPSQGRIACHVDLGGDVPVTVVLHVNYSESDGRWWSNLRWKPEDGPSRTSGPWRVEGRA